MHKLTEKQELQLMFTSNLRTFNFDMVVEKVAEKFLLSIFDL